MVEQSPAPRNRWLALLVKVSVSAGILYWIFTFVSPREIASALRASHSGLFFASVLVTLVGGGAAARRMSILTGAQGMSVTAPRIFTINLIANFYGMFLPCSLAGGAVRWRKLYLADRNTLGAFVAIVLNRFLLTTMTVAVGAVYWLSAGRDGLDPRVGLVFFVLLAGLLLIQLTLVFRVRPSALRLGTQAASGQAGVRDRIARLLDALSRYRDLSRGALLAAGGLALVEELLGLASFALMSLAAGISVPLLHLGWVRAFILLVTMVPISFLGIGVQEGTLIALLGGYGVSAAEAVAFSFLLVTRSILLAGLGGVLEVRDVFLPPAPRTHDGAA